MMENNERANILIVDDRQENIFAMEQLLDDMDVQIFTAQSGNEALRLMLNTEFALVLLDVQMPGMDGFEMATMMRENDQTKHIPIIFVTAISKEERHVFKGYDSGAVDYLFKPINPEILRSKVRVFSQLYLVRLECRKMERQLQQARNLDAISELAGGIAHDFNNLLTSTMGSIELASMMMPEERVQKLLGNAMKSSLEAMELARTFISFSKSGILNISDISVDKVIRETADAALKQSTIKFNYRSVADNLPLLRADENQLNRLFYNLFLNAREAMPHGGTITVTVEYCETMPSCPDAEPMAPSVIISVSDNGSGISTKNLPRIFEPYFSTKQKGTQKGLGLGLTLCYSIVKKHGGFLTVQSKEGKGTVMQICLPLSPKISTDNSSEINKKTTNKVKILIFDEDELIRNLTADLLRALDYKVEIAVKGEEAVKMYAENKEADWPFDVVFLMVSRHQEGLGGVDILKRLRAVDPHIKAIASIDGADDLEMNDYKEKGFCAAISKPYGMVDLANTMRNILNPLNLKNGFYKPY